MRIAIWVSLFFLLSSVGPPSDSLFFSEYQPIFMEREELEKSISMLPAKPIRETGKIFLYREFLFAVEPFKGVHVFNNSNASAPVAVGFIRIPGCVDVAVKGDLLYADNAVDLVQINIASLPSVQVINRLPNAFPELSPPDNRPLPIEFSTANRPASLIIVEWTRK
ncbi:MAG TPA: hypothetical protein VFV37_07470 [Luteibaculaceae bacterium]|nr:hypothetical protein [Luteibaculaceae bacterium]